MNEYQNAGENCSFGQCGPYRGYPYVGRNQHSYYNKEI